ncbi:HAD family hydrolase [Commensalibacter papalotli (ex Servin-Garciduenas et al. 2014)]|uniref:phosphoglycolate phosphatase n=1 Tax=Commensalibacter papalotli (ex Servin-Garciduenas et al. 2014) TaxID=1208583 RepID=W7DUQ5_9PROT|nr:HAD-IA family hydrolase [Commensalibacter papalotli (ex Servin-Garciduenas et al. 2014)]EUK18700.1 phosphoglycolate phosphatase [Commensalibacter papalotli (ex Servin-Garciduenas et al. 2014)]
MSYISNPVIVFDMDGTLIDSLPDLANSARFLMKEYDLPSVTDQDVRLMIGDGMRVLVERLFAFAGDKASAINFEEAMDHFIAYYMDHSTEYSKPFDGAVQAMEEFKKRGWKIALCTNKITKAAEQILVQLKIDHFFDAVGGGDLFADKKPNACHLEGIMKMLNADPAKTVMVGDHINDILVAKNAKIAGSIFAAWGYGKPVLGQQATRSAHSISKLPDLAESIIIK